MFPSSSWLHNWVVVNVIVVNVIVVVDVVRVACPLSLAFAIKLRCCLEVSMWCREVMRMRL